jgi:hypothetical protein
LLCRSHHLRHMQTAKVMPLQPKWQASSKI